MDVRLDDGTIIRGVPDGITKQELLEKLQRNSLAVAKQTVSTPQTSLAGKLAMGDRPELTFPQYAGKALKEIPIPMATTAAGAATGGLGGAMAGSALGETLNQALGVYGQSVMPGVDQPDMASVGVAAVAPAVIPALAKTAQGVKWLGGKATDAVKQAIEPLSEKGREVILARFRAKLANHDPKLLAQLADTADNAPVYVPGSNPTAAQAISGVPGSTGFAAHEQQLSKIPGVSTQFADRTAQQEAARLNALSSIARNEGALEGEKAVRSTITAPMREAALTRANVAGQEVPQLERIITQSTRATDKAKKQLAALQPKSPPVDQNALRSAVETHAPAPLPTPLRTQSELIRMKLLPEQIEKRGREIAGARDALQGLEAQGMQPLQAGAITKSIQTIASDKDYRASDVVRKTLGDLNEKIASLADRRGTIDAFDLYTIRKEAGNTIQKFADESKTFDKRLTSGLLSSVQRKIDEAIESAGGKGWKEYLGKYQELSGPINRMETGQKLMTALQNPLETGERSQVFAKAVKDTDLSALSAKDFMDVRGIADDLSRADAFQRLARGTNMSGSEAIPGDVGGHLPNLLYRPAMVANYVMKKMGASAEDLIAQTAATQHLDKQEFAKALRLIPQLVPMGAKPPSRYDLMMQEILKRQAPLAAGIAAQH